MNRLRGVGLSPRGVYRLCGSREGKRVDDQDDREYSRSPELEDLLTLCKALNAEGVRDLLIGGFARPSHERRRSLDRHIGGKHPAPQAGDVVSSRQRDRADRRR